MQSMKPKRSLNLNLTLALLAFAQLIISLDINIVFVALPIIGDQLGFTDQTLQWVVSAYTVFCGGFLLLGGRAADLVGQRRMFIFALWLYALSSLTGGLASSPAVMIVARAVQGVGGAFLFPATLSLITRLFDEGAPRNRALAIWGGAGASGLTLGSLAGGFLTNAFGWPSVFFVNVLLAGIAIAAAFFVIPKDGLRSSGRKFDFFGALTVTAGATLMVYALVEGPELGWSSPPVSFALVVAMISLAAFILIETKSSAPLMQFRLLKNRHLIVGVLVTFIYMGTFGALPYFETLLFQNVYGFTPLETGLAFVIPSIAIFSGTQLGARLATRATTKSALISGCIIGTIGTGLLVPAVYAGVGYWPIVAGLIVSGVGQGIVWTAMWITAATGVENHEQGVASGMASTMLNVGNAIGLAILIALVNMRGTTSLENSVEHVLHGVKSAFLYAAIGIVMALMVSLLLPNTKTR